MLNRFCLLSNPTPHLNPLFLTDNIKLDGIPTCIESNIIASFILHFKFWEKVSLWKGIRCSYQFFCFLLFYMNFYSSYYILCLFRISFNIYLKKYFCHNFFFNRFTKTPHPLKSEQSKSAKHDESFLLMFPKYNRSYLVELSNLIQFSI